MHETNTVTAPVRIKRISVAAVLDGTYDGGHFKPLDAERLKSIQNLVAAAVGADLERGDLVDIQSAALSQPYVPPVPNPVTQLRSLMADPVHLYGAIGAGFFLLIVDALDDQAVDQQTPGANAAPRARHPQAKPNRRRKRPERSASLRSRDGNSGRDAEPRSRADRGARARGGRLRRNSQARQPRGRSQSRGGGRDSAEMAGGESRHRQRRRPNSNGNGAHSEGNAA